MGNFPAGDLLVLIIIKPSEVEIIMEVDKHGFLHINQPQRLNSPPDGVRIKFPYPLKDLYTRLLKGVQAVLNTTNLGQVDEGSA